VPRPRSRPLAAVPEADGDTHSPAARQAAGPCEVHRRYSPGTCPARTRHRHVSSRLAGNAHPQAGHHERTAPTVTFCIALGWRTMQGVSCRDRSVLRDWSRPIHPACLLRACSDAPVRAGSSRHYPVRCSAWQGQIFAGTGAKAQVVAGNCRTEQRTLNPRVRGSSPWRRTRTDLGFYRPRSFFMRPFCPRGCSVVARAHGPSNPGLSKTARPAPAARARASEPRRLVRPTSPRAP
jgi:hypothetical protein